MLTKRRLREHGATVNCPVPVPLLHPVHLFPELTRRPVRDSASDLYGFRGSGLGRVRVGHGLVRYTGAGGTELIFTCSTLDSPGPCPFQLGD